MKPPSYADPYQRQLFAKWLESERIRTNTSKTELSEATGREGTHQINQFLDGKVLPLPRTLRQLCGTMGIPWFSAFVNAGYYRSILHVLANLASLGRDWCAHDSVYPSTGESEFRFTGVLKIGDAFAVDAIEKGDHAKRYLAGTWEEQDGSALSCVAPKPLALSLFVGVAGFPRRGDVYKDGLAPYAADLLTASHDLVDLADRGDDASAPPGLLKDVDGALKNPSLPFEHRRAIAGEYMMAWCDQQSQSFTYYARLAIYDSWGEVGSSASTVTPYCVMPQIRKAECPELSAFAVK